MMIGYILGVVLNEESEARAVDSSHSEVASENKHRSQGSQSTDHKVSEERVGWGRRVPGTQERASAITRIKVPVYLFNST